MLDQLSRARTPLAGWIWSETRQMDFKTIFCPFTGRPFIPNMFKEEGKGVITADLLKVHYHLAHALIENETSALDPFDVDTLLEKNPDKIQLVEGVCNAYGVMPEHGAWLDNVHKNIEKIEDPYKKSLAISVCTNLIRYLMSFDDVTRCIAPDEDLSGIFNFYVEFFNGKIFSNGLPCEAHCKEAHKMAASVDSDAMYFYIPSSIGYARLSPERRLLELFCRYCTEAELDKQLLIDTTYLGASHTAMPHYQATLEAFLEKSAHIPTWIISYNQAGLFTEDSIKNMIDKFKSKVQVLTRKVIHSSAEAHTEILYIAQN